MLHAFPGHDTMVEEDGHIGHGAVLHGCIVQRNALVGMNAVVNDNAVIGESAIVAAMAFVKAGMIVPPRTLVAGIPARVVRALTEQELAWKVRGHASYQRAHAALARDDARDRAARGARARPPAHLVPDEAAPLQRRCKARERLTAASPVHKNSSASCSSRPVTSMLRDARGPLAPLDATR